MKTKLINFADDKTSEFDLPEALFGLPVRSDLLHRYVEWQRAKARTGTHKTKGISEISGTTKKPHKQKGTGSARAGSRRAPQMRGGATIFGPVVRSHAYSLPKKLRKLALKTALSAKHASGSLVILEEAKIKDCKTSILAKFLKDRGLNHALIIDGDVIDTQFALSLRNIMHIDILPSQGANVYDILRHKQLVLTKAAVDKLQERLA